MTGTSEKSQEMTEMEETIWLVLLHGSVERYPHHFFEAVCALLGSVYDWPSLSLGLPRNGRNPWKYQEMAEKS
ncbi:hypothetical protein Taro_022508 [Colocasia esculenta]|uniref:Uncharacterized protein n=1 Tax=Colocasia esculenta TaxID=4460 RepID=A0A843V1K8_COLES|nr:hypothetical protein [Colocasia esculenta]